MNSIMKAAGALLAASAICSFAQEAAIAAEKAPKSFKLGIGAVARHFEDTEIKGTSGGGTVSTYSRGAMNETVTTVTSGTKGDMDVETEDSFGPVISLEYALWQKGAVTLSLAGGFEYYNLDNSCRMAGVTTVTKSYTPAARPEQGSVTGDVSTTVDSFKADMDLDLYILDLGLKVFYEFSDSFSVYAACGPALTIADAESKVGGRHDSGTDCVAGLYAGIGAAYWFSERVGVAVEARYDDAFETVGTDDVKQDLDGFGCAVKVLFGF